MTSPTPLKDILDQSQVKPVGSVAELENTLKESGFAAELKSWASVTSAGAAHYVVGISNNLFKPAAQGQTIVKVYCEKTPKLVTVPKWKTTSSNPLRWQYQLSTAPSQIVTVLIRADDRTRLEMLVGSCLKPGIRLKFNNKPKLGRVTLGLVFRHKDEMWTIVVAHSFETENVKVTHASEDYVVLECKPGANGGQCEACSQGQCENGCTLEKAKILAKGREQIYRTLNRMVFDLAIVKIPNPLSSPVQPLDVTEFIEFFKKIDNDSVYNKTFLEIARRSMPAIENFRGVSQRYASSSFLQMVASDPEHHSMLMFKKGMNTNWTWGLLAEANEKEFSVVSPVASGKTPIISDQGDCGSTWFILDLEYKTAVPVGHHQGRDAKGMEVEGEGFDLAYGQPYHTAFSEISNVEDLETIRQISGFKTADITIKFSECFTPIAKSRS